MIIRRFPKIFCFFSFEIELFMIWHCRFIRMEFLLSVFLYLFPLIWCILLAYLFSISLWWFYCFSFLFKRTIPLLLHLLLSLLIYLFATFYSFTTLYSVPPFSFSHSLLLYQCFLYSKRCFTTCYFKNYFHGWQVTSYL